MPIAMNFDLLSNSNHHQDRCEHMNECESHLEIKLSKSPLSNGTNRSSIAFIVPPLVKPRIRQIVNRSTRNIDLERLSRCSSTNQIALPKVENEKWSALASSNEHILVGGGSSSTLRLFDLNGNQIRLIDIKTFGAFDLAWSSVLNAFLIAGYDRLQAYNTEKDQLIQIENINLINRKDNYFWSIACHGNDVFIVLSDGLESVWRLSLPSFKRIQTLSGSEIRESNSDDRISCIRTNGYSVGMTLRQRTTCQWRVDLFDYATMTRTHRGLTIGYGIGAFNFIERCMLAPIDDHQWLIIGGYKVTPNALTLMDDRTGEVKQVERQWDQQEEFISNICTSENSKQQQIISMIIIDNLTGQRQMHVMQQ
ncbi:unnamed protein product [Rotaria socialis]|uniref:Uncharacterized protein n=1 Tax=Rotaria socialis TaxID=392032 RepID=A0A817XYQ0_9BILA|nr:unnamed protein product [Rotaria socialis]CAF3372669.1 unnamed protein product [Rotaria socialis]CAF3408159.1 unnamed protein product [Rotaria socialis]CAF3428085.1 unnamed protein product [Rotaria socialis]CAF3474401.1 unnamed protein product [Rotaria socialis]